MRLLWRAPVPCCSSKCRYITRVTHRSYVFTYSAALLPGNSRSRHYIRQGNRDAKITRTAVTKDPGAANHTARIWLMGMPKLLFSACLLLCVLVVPPAPVFAQDERGPVHEERKIAFDSSMARIGVLTQVVADVEFDGPEDQDASGLTLATARLRLDGNLDRGFSYFSQFDFSGSPAVLDAKVGFEASPAFGIEAGRFKVPFSAEYLISASSTDYIGRAQVAGSVERRRQVGVAIRGAAAGGLLGYSAGVFTGNGRGANGESRLYAVRLTAVPVLPGDNLETGAVLVYQDDQGAIRVLASGDARFSNARLLLSAEVVRANHNPELGTDSLWTGFHATAGYMLKPHRHQVLARWDGLSAEDGGSRHFIILGYNTWPARAVKIQINYQIPARGSQPGGHRVMLNCQVAL